MTDTHISERYEFRNIKQNEAEEAAEIERICFPPNEACSKKHMKDRVAGIARSRNLVTDFGKVMDAIADKVLVNGLLIILAYDGFISIAIPVIIITRDIFVDSFKMASGKKGKVVAASFTGKAKTMCMMIGMALTMFYNLPFELIGINVGYALIIIATILSIISACEYYYNTKDTFKAK